ncbi:plasmid pRiA4b ORF-3 family protein [Hoeflea sp.]|uniref:plasmid pRiA4b ORF-3 family protein n=1 Tax=Hoeflea sp. TaxID=1940281 RepID=UPI003B01FFC8
MAQAGNQLDIVRLSITLRDVKPRVTRRMDVPANTCLNDLHLYIQAAMGWHNCHLWEFEAIRYEQVVTWSADSDQYFSSPKSDASATVLDVIDFLQGKPEFNYLYDFGDSWRHKIRIGKIQSAHKDRQYPYLVSGSGRCPLEDIGGVWGYSEFLAAFENPDSEYREYYPDYFDGSDNWNPEDAELEKRRAAIARFQ